MTPEQQKIFDLVVKHMKDATEVSLFDEEQIEREVMRLTEKLRGVNLNKHPDLGVGYRVICDETNNTPQDIENGVVNATIILPPSLVKIDMTPVDQGDE
jgi:hypothetical protein